MAKLQYVGKRKRKAALYYVAIDGTKFYTWAGGGQLNAGEAHRAASAHSRKVLADQGLELRGSGLYSPEGTYYGEDWGTALSTFQSEKDTEQDITTAKGEFEEQLGEHKSAIKKAGAELEQLAEKRSARTTSVMTRGMVNALLERGEDPARIQAVQERIKAASGRQLQDVLSGVKAQTLQQLAGAEKFDVTAGMDFDQIQLQRQSLQDAMIKFLADQQLQRDKFQAQIDMQPEWWQSALAGFSQGVGQGVGTAATTAAIASDKRLKENISQVGTLDNGLPVYVFNFKGDTKTQIGLMAQDVEKVNKDAVIEIDGIKFLNYKMAVQ